MKGFKTLFASAAITIIGAMQQAGFVNLIPQNYQGIAIAFIGLMMALLRLFTDTPALKSK